MVNLERHARHLSLPNVGLEGQQRLTESSVLVIGAGGLGSPVALYLAAAGVGRIGLVDNDRVDISNLQRQILHSTSDIGALKVDSAKASLEAIDPNITVEIFPTRLRPENALDILGNGWDVVVDGTDNLPTRYLIDDACSILNLTWVYGSIFRFEGQVSVFGYQDGPRYRDLFPEAPPAEAVPSCAEAGVFGILPGMVGTLQATEAIKLLLELPPSLNGKLLVYDALEMSFTHLSFEADPERVPVRDLKRVAKMLTDEQWCEPSALPAKPQEQKSSSDSPTSMFNQLPMAEFLQRRESGWTPFILDVRSDGEYQQAHVASCDLQVPHTAVLSIVEQLPKDSDIVIHCKSGMRSQLAAIELIKAGWAGKNLYNLEGGIIAWKMAAPEEIV